MLLETHNIAGVTDTSEHQPHIEEHAYQLPAYTQEIRTFDTPRSIWIAMLASYAIFFLGLALATGRDRITLFMIVVSAGYACMYFGTAYALNSISRSGRTEPVPVEFDTYAGKLSYWASFAQMLTVPMLVALFAMVIAIIRTIVAP